MSVFTSINLYQLEGFLNFYSLGELIDFTGIQAGIENTNYRVTTTQGQFILTLFEELSALQLPCFMSLLNHLCKANFPAPEPQQTISGQFLSTLKDKPVALFKQLPGYSLSAPSTFCCGEIGEYLAKLHVATRQYAFKKSNTKNLAGCQSIFAQIKSSLSTDDIHLLTSEFEFQEQYLTPSIPQGVIHADLFTDNVLFEQQRITGIVDFYSACNDYYLFDIAITCNDWCVENQMMNQPKLNEFLKKYHKIRPLNHNEIKYLPVFLRRAALRFWLSRLKNQLHPKKAELTLAKDPFVFRQLLEYHRNSHLIKVVLE